MISLVLPIFLQDKPLTLLEQMHIAAEGTLLFLPCSLSSSTWRFYLAVVKKEVRLKLINRVHDEQALRLIDVIDTK